MTRPMTRQRDLRGHHPPRPAARAANSTDHQAALAWRLTARDRWLLGMVHEHRVLTSHQIAAMAFPSQRSARLRLRELYLWSVLDRFQPFTPVGAAPQHYVLGPAGATVLAAEHGLDPTRLGYRRERVNAIAHSLRLAHTVAVNDWFAALAATTRTTTGNVGDPADGSQGRLEAWWSETRCARHFGDLTRPDAYARYTDGTRRIEFFLEYDTGTEALPRLARKLPGYAALATATAITTPLLIWLPTTRREATARRVLHDALAGLDNPHAVRVATAASDLSSEVMDPARAVWLPLSPSDPGRVELARLADVWTDLPPPPLVSPAELALDPGRELPAPTPTPPPGARSTTAG